MDPTRTTPVALAERRLAWLESRQRVLAQNIANADTPGYRPRDLRPFAEALAPAGGAAPGSRPDRQVAERAPNGNAVALDQQALKVADADTAHAFATGLHRRYLGMFRTALGRGQ